jgi:hypothetical protein
MPGKSDRLDFDVDEDTAAAFRALAAQYDSQAECLDALLEQHAEELNESPLLAFYPRRKRGRGSVTR